MISFDTETTSTDQMRAELVGVSLAVDPGKGYYIPVGHRQGEQLPLKVVLDALRGPLTDERIPKAGHNLKYDYVVLARNGLRPRPLAFDTMIAEWLINPASRNLGLKNLAWVRLDYRMTEIEELIGKGAKQISMADVPITQAAAYAGDDAAVVLRLIPQLQSEMDERKATRLFREMEMPLIEVLAGMEMAGIALDKAFLGRMSSELSERMSAIEARSSRPVACLSISTPSAAFGYALRALEDCPPDRTQKTSTGFYSTAAGILESMSGKHPVIDMVLEYRELSKLRSTYLDACPCR